MDEIKSSGIEEELSVLRRMKTYLADLEPGTKETVDILAKVTEEVTGFMSDVTRVMCSKKMDSCNESEEFAEATGTEKEVADISKIEDLAFKDGEDKGRNDMQYEIAARLIVMGARTGLVKNVTNLSDQEIKAIKFKWA